MQTIQNTIIGTLESVKDKLEQRDVDVAKRGKVFAEAGVAAPSQSDVLQEQENAEIKPDFDKFKKVSFELLDIGLHYGNQGAEKIASQPLYQRVDGMINIADKFTLVKRHGQ